MSNENLTTTNEGVATAGHMLAKNSLWKKIALFLSTIGPGLFLVGYNIGTGSITTMASAGASHGMILSWAVLLSCIFTYFLIVYFGRYTLLTGESALQAFRKHFGRKVALFVLSVLVFTEMVSSIGVMAIVTDVVNEWSKPLTADGEGISTILLAILFGGMLVFLLINNRYGFIEKLLALFVALMGISFLMTATMVIPDASVVIAGLVPSIPDTANAGLIVAGMIGTTMGGVLYVARSITVKEKQWKASDLKLEKRDAFISSFLMFFLSLSIMAAAAGTLHPQGLHVENAIDMIQLLEPLAGRFAISIFVVGIVCAGLSSLFPHYMLVPLLLADYRNKPMDLSSKTNKTIIIFYAALGLVVPIFGGRPVLVMIITQVFALLITPIILILMTILQNRKSVMGDQTVSPISTLMLVAMTLFTIFMAVVGVIGIIEAI
ncbi:Nramp family divalent metal transporter [Microbulbifer elongatus]|uniref:Nramp family divalent metal transporter n=1 Tax=Microbulbifer elongatus TaxID=86173 RepID=UPI001CFDC12F|nr:Nramp family divalent metal transporter [Microbulbifer elongatus]